MMYVILEYLVNRQCGFLQRPATILHYYEKPERPEQEKVMERLPAHPQLRNFPAEHVVTPGDQSEWVTLCAARLPVQTGWRRWLE